jgi:hypothetical protein
MGRLDVPGIEIVICKYATAHRAHKYAIFSDLIVCESFGNHFVQDTMTTTRAIVCLFFIASRTPFIGVVEAL